MSPKICWVVSMLALACGTEVTRAGDGTAGHGGAPTGSSSTATTGNTGPTSGAGASSTGSGSSGCACTDEQVCVTCSDDTMDPSASYSYCATPEPPPDPNGPPHFACGIRYCEIDVEMCVEFGSGYCGCSPPRTECRPLPTNCTTCSCIGAVGPCEGTSCEDGAAGEVTVWCESTSLGC